MPNREVRQELNVPQTLASAGGGAVMALVSCCLLLLLSAAAVSGGLIPERSIGTLCMVLCGICALFGARFAVKRGEGPPLFISSLCGLLLCLLLLGAAFFGYEELTLQGDNLRILLAAFLGAAIAGLSQPNKKAKRKKSKRKK